MRFQNSGLDSDFFDTHRLNNDGEHSELDINTVKSLSTLFGCTDEYGCLIYDKSGKLIHKNHLMAKFLNISEDNLDVGSNVFETMCSFASRLDRDKNTQVPKLREELERIEKNVQKLHSCQNKFKVTCPNGTPINIEHRFSKIGFGLFRITDITEKSNNEELLNIAFESANAGYWSLDLKTNEVYFSPHLKSSFTDDEFAACMRDGLWALIHPDDINKTKEIWRKGIQSGKIFNCTCRVNSKKLGLSYFQTTAKAEYSQDGTPRKIVCFVSDISTHYKEILKLAEGKAEAENGLKSLHKFLAQMSHEIRTPMNGITGMTEALLYSVDDPNMAEQISVIADSAHNLTRLLDEVLEHARLNTDKVKIISEPNNPRQMLKGLHTLWSNRASTNGSKLTLHISKNVPKELTFDRFRVEQCLNNLLSNAIKFTRNGHIQLVATMQHNLTDCKQTLIFAVKDNGIGMSAEQRSRIFTPYQQADNTISSRFGGTGLGLSISKQIVQLMGGTIKVKSQVNAGSTFIIQLPIPASQNREQELKPQKTHKSDTPQPPLPANRKSTRPIAIEDHEANNCLHDPASSDETKNITVVRVPDIWDKSETSTDRGQIHQTQKLKSTAIFAQEKNPDRFENLRILVVEDNETNQMVVKALLSQLVKSIHFASNGQQALQSLEMREFDIVLMDIHMPVMDGIETTIAIRNRSESWSDIGIIALTADPEYQQVRICRNIGMNNAISKPVSLTAITQAFDDILEGETQLMLSKAV